MIVLGETHSLTGSRYDPDPDSALLPHLISLVTLLVFDGEVLFLGNGDPCIVLRSPVAIYLLLFLLSMVWL